MQPRQQVIVLREPANPIPIRVPRGKYPVAVVAGLVGWIQGAAIDGDGVVVEFPPFGEATVPPDLLG